jgi:cysteinyl-tRNA synthetase
MSVTIYNTLTQKKEPLKPLEPGHVKLYVCGITSYDYCHIGHARSSLVFDLIVKYLRYRGYRVTFVRNFTDIDDKIINRANEQGVPAQELAARFIDEFYRDMDYLGLERPDIEPKATEHIPEMIALIETLIEQGKAYAVDGDVYFGVQSFPEYGKLSRRNLDDMQAGARISINEKKRHPMDFVLWKHAKPGEPFWDSPWGPGRPGWHIECSAMSKKYLGDTFDIHGGGKDLIFPHHENEIAQSEAANHRPFVNMWVHHGFVTVRNEETAENEKMSKSLGNFLTIRELSEKYHPEILKLFIFSTQYRNPLEYSEQAMLDAESGLTRLYESLAGIEAMGRQPDPAAAAVITAKDRDKLKSLETRFQKAMDNDFNSAQAIGQLFDAAKTVNKILHKLQETQHPDDLAQLDGAHDAIQRQGRVLGIFGEAAAAFLERRKRENIRDAVIDPAAIEALIARRNEARQNKDWKLSDAIRDELLAQSIELKDGPNGTAWSVKRE